MAKGVISLPQQQRDRWLDFGFRTTVLFRVNRASSPCVQSVVGGQQHFLMYMLFLPEE